MPLRPLVRLLLIATAAGSLSACVRTYIPPPNLIYSSAGNAAPLPPPDPLPMPENESRKEFLEDQSTPNVDQMPNPAAPRLTPRRFPPIARASIPRATEPTLIRPAPSHTPEVVAIPTPERAPLGDARTY